MEKGMLEMAKIVLRREELRIQSALLEGNYNAVRSILAKEGSRIRPVYRCIFEASLAFAEGNAERAWSAIAEGLKLDGRNYELYMLLGEYYASQNLRQTYLCYENALFYCDDPDDCAQIASMLEQISEQGIYVPRAAIVILSYNLLHMTRDCIDSIRETIPPRAREIIVVDNASTDGSVAWLQRQRDVKVLCNTENKGFPAGCNQGIELAELDSDIFLLNNDTILPDNALFWLRMGLYENEEAGCVGSVSNYVSNFQAVIENGKSREEYLEFAKNVNIPVKKPYLNKMHLVGFALLLKRSVLNQIGLLDERFSPGNWEDNDICLRMNLAGYRNVLCRNSFVIHWGSQSFGKERSKYGNILEINQRKFFEKWSAIHLEEKGYLRIRTELISIIEHECGIFNGAIMVVGTDCGGILSSLQEEFPDAQVYGMEPHMYMAKIADRIADTVYTDLDALIGDELAEAFDIIVINDVLEHTKNPETVLKELVKMLKPEGKIVFSFVNSQHYTRIGSPDENRKFFSYKRALELLFSAKLTENIWQYTMLVETPEEVDRKVEYFQKRYPAVTRDELLAHQWINVVEKQRTDIRFDNKIAVCIPTYERSEIVEEVLLHSAEVYWRYGLDVYFYDSSRNEKTKNIIEAYRQKGYDNLYYIAVDPELYVARKLERVLMMDGIQKEYDYMWYRKDRVWCGERTLRVIYRAISETPDIIFLDIEHSDCSQEITVCGDINAFYHRCGAYATSIDTTIYNVRTILKNNFSLDAFHRRHGEYSDSFFHFLVLFEQLAKKRDPKICMLAGGNVVICNAFRYENVRRTQSIETWVKRWIWSNEALPECYADKEDVIKRAASLPWLMGSMDTLIEWHNKGVLTPEYFEEIKEYWERVSDIPLETLRKIAYGEYIV